MVNLLHLCESMTIRWYKEEEINLPFKQFEKFARRNHFFIKKRYENGTTKYKLIRQFIPVYFISGPEVKRFKFMDIADLHIGHEKFSEKALRASLQKAQDNGVKMVFIAGDIFEGTCSDSCETTYLQQIDLAYSIFKDYKFEYYAINGNHDYSFEQIGLPNPIERLANKLKQVNIKFHYFEEYIMDFVICGVIKRVMHVERQDFNKQRIFAALKIKYFEEEKMLSNTHNKTIYPVRFFQVGHIHVNVQMYYSKRKVFISQSGSFLSSECKENRENIIQGKIIDGKIFMN